MVTVMGYFQSVVRTTSKQLTNSSFIRSVITLVTGTAVAQLITVGASPIITRLFTPSTFGAFALFFATQNVIANVGCLCYQRAILLPRCNREALNVLAVSIVVLLVVCAIILVLVFPLNHSIAHALGNEDLAFWLLFIPVAVLLNGGVLVFRFWRLRQKEFNAIACSRVGDAIASVATKILAAFVIGPYTGVLIMGTMAGTLMGLCLMVMKPRAFNFKEAIEAVSKSELMSVAKKYKSFPFFASWNVLLSFFSQNLPTFVMAVLFAPSIAGFYHLGNRVLKQPLGLLSDAIQNAYFEKSASQNSENKRLTPGLKKTVLVLAITGIIPFSVLAIFGPDISEIIFGHEWRTVGQYIQIMAPWLFVAHVSSPANVVYEVCQKQGLKLFINASMTVSRFLALMGGYKLYGEPVAVLAIFTLTNFVFESGIIVGAFIIARKSDKCIGIS